MEENLPHSKTSDSQSQYLYHERAHYYYCNNKLFSKLLFLIIKSYFNNKLPPLHLKVMILKLQPIVVSYGETVIPVQKHDSHFLLDLNSRNDCKVL